MSRIGLGAMRLALGRAVPPPADAIALLRRAVELGVDHIDTAGNYGFGESQAHELIRKALHPYAESLVIATKVTGGDLRAQVESDLRRLGVERLDLVYLRTTGLAAPGGEPIGERFAALAEMRREGLIRDLGVSHVDAAQLAEAQAVEPVAAVQNQFHVHHRANADVLARCEKAGIAFLPYFPLGGGGAKIDHSRLEAVAARHNATTSQVALAWLLAVSPAARPIPGTTSIAHLTENLAAAGLHLADDDMAELL
ncbi:aldo/keto reductase [Actinoplanes sp. NPDC051513]|uniref:aldo/keto reductase n=1 Tax=Actinoplanes sp. NPDC051513 TaxID=3363908 RepID=UPI0037BA708C